MSLSTALAPEMVKLDQAEVDAICAKHDRLWSSKPGGARAVFAWKDISDIDLRGRNLSDADFTGAIMAGCQLQGARLDHANLFGCDLQNANMQLVHVDAGGSSAKLLAPLQ